MAGYIGRGQPMVSNGAERKFKYTATAGQTTFSATYSIGNVHVYRTGVRLTDGVDYTATNGSSVTLTTGCNAGDDVVIVSTSGFQVADAYTKAELANHDQLTVDVNGRIYPKDLVDISTVGGSRIYASSMQTYTAISSISPDGASHVPHYHNSERHTIQTLGVDRLSVDSAGRVTMPYQPSFNAYEPPVTTHGNTIVNWGATRSNVGGHFNTSTGLFTAPIAGTYCFSFGLLVRYTSAYAYHRILFKVNGSASTRYHDNLAAQTFPYSSAIGSTTIFLNAGDTVGLQVEGSETYGSQYGSFSGHLVG